MKGTPNDQSGSPVSPLAWRFSFDLASFQAREANSYNQTVFEAPPRMVHPRAKAAQSPGATDKGFPNSIRPLVSCDERTINQNGDRGTLQWLSESPRYPPFRMLTPFYFERLLMAQAGARCSKLPQPASCAVSRRITRADEVIRTGRNPITHACLNTPKPRRAAPSSYHMS